MTPASWETLQAILADPKQAVSLSPEEATALLASLAAAQWALASQLRLSATVTGPSKPARDADRLLTPSEAAERLGVTVRWLYRRASGLPFTRRLSRKALRFSEAGLQRYLDGQEAKGKTKR